MEAARDGDFSTILGEYNNYLLNHWTKITRAEALRRFALTNDEEEAEAKERGSYFSDWNGEWADFKVEALKFLQKRG